MKNLTIKKGKLLSLSVLAAIVLCFAGIGIYSLAAQSPAVSITLDKKIVTLEKNESYTFDVTVSGTTDEVEWAITDDTVAKIEKGKVTALKEGSTVVTAKVKDKTARCQVKVTDNGLVLNIVTNVGNEKLNILVGDAFDLTYIARYNNKTVDAKISATVLNGEIASIEGGRILGKKAGVTQIVLEAEWNGMKAVDVIDLGVVYNIIADYENGSYVKIYNDPRAGAKTAELAPRLIENGKELAEGEFEVYGVDYDEKIISFDKDTLVVTGLSKGKTELEIVYKSKVTGNTVASAVEVEVDLYTEDKSSSINLGKAYIDEGSLAIDINKVFADLTSGQLAGLSVIRITDVTGAYGIKIPVENNVADMSSFIAGGIVGDRLWEIQCEKYSYIVGINVSEYDKYKFLVGEYISADYKYRYVLTNENDELKVAVYNAGAGSLIADGTFEVRDDSKNSGRIELKLNSSFNGERTIYGVYMNREPMRLSLSYNGKYNDAYSLAAGPYEKVADAYSCNNWLVNIRLNADKTCEFDVGNKVGLNQTGSYVLTPSGLDGGTIVMPFKNAIMGVTSFEGKYSTDGKKYSFGIKVNGKSYYFTQNGEVSTGNAVMAAFGGGDSSLGTSANGQSAAWCTLYFGTDGTMYFDVYYYSEIATVGTYSLTGDKKSGTITFDIEKAYCGYKHFEGTYKFDETTGKYVFDMFVYGSGHDNIRFTQK